MGVAPEGSGMAMDDDNMDDMEDATDGMGIHTLTHTHTHMHTHTHTHCHFSNDSKALLN